MWLSLMKMRSKLRDQIRHAQTVNPKDQNTFDKAIIKLDEKINIANMVFSGGLLKIFPIANDAQNTWLFSGRHHELPTKCRFSGTSSKLCGMGCRCAFGMWTKRHQKI